MATDGKADVQTDRNCWGMNDLGNYRASRSIAGMSVRNATGGGGSMVGSMAGGVVIFHHLI